MIILTRSAERIFNPMRYTDILIESSGATVNLFVPLPEKQDSESC